MAGRIDSGDEPTGPVEPPTPFRWVVLAGVWLVYASFGMATVSLAPLVEPIVRDLGISHGTMGLVFGAWQMVFILSAVPLGALVDGIGARRALLIASAMIAASGLLRSTAPDTATLWFAVAVFGLGGPIVSIGAPKLISGWFHGPERGFAMGIYATGPSLGSITALSTTNSILMPTFDGDWRAILQLWALVAALVGCVWLAIAVQPQMRKSDAGLTTRKRTPQTTVVLELLRFPSVQILLAMAVGIFTFNHGLNNWLPEVLRGHGLSPAAAGYWSTIPTIVGIFGALFIPRLATPSRRYWLLIGLCIAAGLASLMLRAQSGPVLVAGLFMQGIARSSLTTIMLLALVEMPGIGEARAGVASGLFFSAGEVGGACGPLLLGLLHDWSGGFGLGLSTLSVISLALFFGALRMQALARGPKQSSGRPQPL